MHFSILKMIATSGFLTALECTEFVFGRGSARTSLGEIIQRSPDPVVGLRGALLLRGEEGRGRERKR